MQIQLKATEIELTEQLKDYAEKKVLALSKYLSESNEEATASVELAKTTAHHRKGDVFRAEISLRSHGEQYYASSEKEDLYTAIDTVKDDILRELVSSKDKRISLVRRGGARIKNIIKGGIKRLNW